METAEYFTRERLAELVSKTPRLLHLACHGSSDAPVLHLEDRILAVDSLRAQIADQSQSSVGWYTYSGDATVQPTTVTYSADVLPRALPNKVPAGDTEETFVGGTNRYVPAIGAAPEVVSWTGTSFTSYTIAGTLSPDYLAYPTCADSLLQTQPVTVYATYPAPETPTGDRLPTGAPTVPCHNPLLELGITFCRLLNGPLPLATAIQGVPRLVGVVRIDLSTDLRRDLLRLLDGIRSALRLALILLRTALLRRPSAHAFLLILLAVSRHYGRRSEPDDHLLPARTPMSVIRGELVLAC